MRRPILMLVSLALATIMLSGGVALARSIVGTENDDHLIGTKHADSIYALEGNDVVKGRQGNDTLYGGAGDDQVYGGRGNDKIFGRSGVDKQYGGKGRDRIWSAGEQADVVDCGRGGRDWAEVDSLDQVVNCERVEVVTP